LDLSLDDFFPNQAAACYRYFLKIELAAQKRPMDVGLDSIRLENDLQMAPLSLPALELGNNTITYTDETSQSHAARITFQWVESSGITPPAPPAGPIFPADGAEVEGTTLRFCWQEAEFFSGRRIADYQFQLCEESGCRWPLSSRFDLLVSADGGQVKAEHLLSRAGLLNPGQRYWWRVRAQSDTGAWSHWSQAWSFIPRGPGTPVSLTMIPGVEGEYALEWEADPSGRRPVQYLVYASDEKGFTPSDAAFEAAVGNQRQRGLFPGRDTMVFPANFLEKTTVPRLLLVPTRAFYRVIAVDEKGNRSGPSDWVAGPRPFIYSQPVKEARVGVLYRFEAKTVVSIGNLIHRDFLPEEFNQIAFWAADKPRFSLVGELPRCGIPQPEWLQLDPETGVLSGTPAREHIGEYQINLKVEIQGAGLEVFSFPLIVRE
jgi:hypothetical protein